MAVTELADASPAAVDTAEPIAIPTAPAAREAAVMGLTLRMESQLPTTELCIRPECIQLQFKLRC